MGGHDTISSLPPPSLDIAEPPHKRPRIADSVNLAATNFSRALSPRPKLSGASKASSNIFRPQWMSSSTSLPPRSSMTMFPDRNLDTSEVMMGDATSSSASSSGSTRRSSTERSGATLLVPTVVSAEGELSTPTLTSGELGSDGQGLTVGESIQSYQNLNSFPDQLAAEGVIANSPFPTQQQPVDDDADRRESLAGEGKQDRVEKPAARDGEFYIDSADCVIRVDNTLFKVHRYFLGRDCSTFQHMFETPTQSHVLLQNTEGCSDENPIWLYGESEERFHALLSVIYHLPLQLQIYNTPAANVDRLLTIAEMTNKYHFASIELWAVDALHNVLSGLHGDPQPQYELRDCSSAWMKRVLKVALLCRHNALRNYVVEQWVERIVARDLRPVHALEIADRGGIRRLLGYAYYVQLLEMGDSFDPGIIEDGKQYSRSRLRTATVGRNGDGNGDDGTSTSAPTSTPASLTCEQRQRLLSGAWSLAQLWETLRTTPPVFQRPDECTYHKQGCLSMWRVVWREVGKAEATLKHGPGDVLGRLRAMQEQLLTHANLSSLTPECRRSALMALKRTIKEVQEDLADHFSNLTLMQVKESVEFNVAECSS